jgi:hypothetical protein
MGSDRTAGPPRDDRGGDEPLGFGRQFRAAGTCRCWAMWPERITRPSGLLRVINERVGGSRLGRGCCSQSCTG